MTQLLGRDESSINSSIATISWTMSIPTDILPYISSSTPLSLSSLTMIMVLLNANAREMYMLGINSNHNISDKPIPTIVVKRICPIPTTKEGLPRSLTTWGFSPRPTMKSKRETHICEKVSICVVLCKRWSTFGLTSIPATIYPMIKGCFISLTRAVTIKTIPTMTASSAKGWFARNNCICTNQIAIFIALHKI